MLGVEQLKSDGNLQTREREAKAREYVGGHNEVQCLNGLDWIQREGTRTLGEGKLAGAE